MNGTYVGMEAENYTRVFNCIPFAMGNFSITVTLLTLPFHILIIKALLVDLRLTLPRYKIILCLSLSDAMQISITVLCVVIGRIFSLTTESKVCHVSRNIMLFSIAMTMALSSFAVSGLSLERYVACIHSFRLHQIFTRERIMFCSFCAVVIGSSFGATSVTVGYHGYKETVMSNNLSLKILSVITIIPTSIMVSAVQLRLLIFSRKKLVSVMPRTILEPGAELTDLRRRQIKIAIIASIVAIAYIIFMFPTGCLSAYELLFGDLSLSHARSITKMLAFVNNLTNPFIYGFGIVDIRRALLRNLKACNCLFLKKG